MTKVASRAARFLIMAMAITLVAGPALWAQNPTATLTGTVTGPDGQPLPGVTVTITSPSLQGTRVTTTTVNGGYLRPLLPPGDYTVTYELDGFATLSREVDLSAAVTTRSDVEMVLATVQEEIVVTGIQSEISSSVTGSSTYSWDEIEALPIARDVDEAVQMTPGVQATGPGGNITIAGAMSYENLWTLNGVVINENVRGQELPLFIEDAIEEVTTKVSGISAEYGRFQGGVINALTKSGGNQFTGSFRTSFDNDDWISRNDLSPDRVDDINQTYEATLGGYLMQDHLWFFTAGRDLSLSESESLQLTEIDVTQENEETRLEGKLTGTIGQSHSLVGTYLEIDETSTNSFFGDALDPGSLTDREDPQEIFSGHYTGILTPSFFVEAQYSEREYQIGKGSGAQSTDFVDGTLMRTRQGSFRYYTPTFCGVCQQELRNNENTLAKGSWFLSTESLGDHDVVFGYDTFSDIRFAVNHQTGSDFTVWDSDFVIDGDTVFPQLYPTGNAAGLPETWIGWWAAFNIDDARPTDFETTSYYVNDSWQLNENWAFNVGVRYDETSGTNGSGNSVLDDSKVSPRLGVSWDVKGDGDLEVHANYGTYVAAPTNTIADSTSSGGAIGLFRMEYGGPIVNGGCTGAGDCIPTSEALQILLDWYLANGGALSLDEDLSNLPNLVEVSIPGETAVIPGTIISPAADEINVGATQRLGSRGIVRGDVVYREYQDFYSNRVDTTTGQVQTPTGPADFGLVGNFGDDILEREYLGLHLQGRYRFGDRWSLGAIYTLSEAEGNLEGETGPGGPATVSPNEYPEYFDPSWSYPVGNLESDQTHRLRAWGIYDLIRTDHHTLSVVLLQHFYSGQHYSLFGDVDTRDFVTNPGYETPPSDVTYFFSDKGEFEFDDITRTDLSFNYSFLWNVGAREVEVFLQPEVLNLFDEDGLVDFDTRIRSADNSNDAGACPNSPDPSGLCIPFNPFTEMPVEGVHWAKRDTFGEPLEEEDFQTPRTFRFSVGFRF